MHFLVSFITSLFHYTQLQYMIFTYKVVIIAGLVLSAAFVAQYTYYAAWWRDKIGKRIVYETICIFLLLIPSALNLFFDLNRVTSTVIAWYDAALLGTVACIVGWGIVVWKKERELVKSSTGVRDGDSDKKKADPDQAQEQGQVHSDS